MFETIKSKMDYYSNFNLSQSEQEIANLRIEKYNISKLKHFSNIIFVLFTILFLSTFLDSKSVALINVRLTSRYIYFSVAIISLVAYVLTLNYLPKHPQQVLKVWYITLYALFAFAIWIGVFGQIIYPGVTFCVFLVALPLLFIDKPSRIIFFLFGISIVFCLFSYNVKDFEVASFDFGNCATFFLLSIATSLNCQITNVREIINEIKLEEQRDIDNLSLLPNKACFERKIKLSLKNKGILLIIDIDNFKYFNDNFGHIYGDGIIREVGKSLKEVFNTNCLLGRFGGDEFVVYLSNIDDTKIIEDKYALLHQRINQLVSSPQYNTKVSISCGGAIYPTHGLDYVTLFKHADRNLYEVKNNGKGTIKIR